MEEAQACRHELPLSHNPSERDPPSEDATPKLSKRQQKKLKQLALSKEKKKYQRQQRKIRYSSARRVTRVTLSKAEEEARGSGERRVSFGARDKENTIHATRISFADRYWLLFWWSHDSTGNPPCTPAIEYCSTLSQEIKSMANQLTRCYSINRKSPVSVKYFLTSFGGATENHLQTQISGFSKWETDYVRWSSRIATLSNIPCR